MATRMTDQAVDARRMLAAAQPPKPDAAALWRRLAARLADILTVVFVVWAVVVLQVLWFMGQLSRAVHPRPWGTAFVPTMTIVALYAVYEIVFVRYNQGQTPGKDVFKIRVVTAAD